MRESLRNDRNETEEEFADLDDMDPEEREALEASIAEGLEEYRRGEGLPMADLIHELRPRNR